MDKWFKHVESQNLCLRSIPKPGWDCVGPSWSFSNLGSNSSLGPGKISLGGGTSSDLFTALEYAGMARSLPKACSGSPGIPALDMPLLCSQLSPTGQGRAYPWKSHGLDQVMARFWMEGGSLGGRVVLCARYCTSLFNVFVPMCV